MKQVITRFDQIINSKILINIGSHIKGQLPLS